MWCECVWYSEGCSPPTHIWAWRGWTRVYPKRKTIRSYKKWTDDGDGVSCRLVARHRTYINNTISHTGVPAWTWGGWNVNTGRVWCYCYLLAADHNIQHIILLLVYYNKNITRTLYRMRQTSVLINDDTLPLLFGVGVRQLVCHMCDIYCGCYDDPVIAVKAGKEQS